MANHPNRDRAAAARRLLRIEQKYTLWRILSDEFGHDHYRAGQIEVALRMCGMDRLADKIESAVMRLSEARRRVAAAEDAIPLDPGSDSFGGLLTRADTPEVIRERDHLTRYTADWSEIMRECGRVADTLMAEIEAQQPGYIGNRQEGELP